MKRGCDAKQPTPSKCNSVIWLKHGVSSQIMEDLQATRPRNLRQGFGWVLQQRVSGPDLYQTLAVRVGPPDQRQDAVGDIKPAAVVGDAVGPRELGGKEVSRQIGEQRWLAVGIIFQE